MVGLFNCYCCLVVGLLFCGLFGLVVCLCLVAVVLVIWFGLVV